MILVEDYLDGVEVAVEGLVVRGGGPHSRHF